MSLSREKIIALNQTLQSQSNGLQVVGPLRQRQRMLKHSLLSHFIAKQFGNWKEKNVIALTSQSTLLLYESKSASGL